MRSFQRCFEEVRTLQKKSWGGSDTLDSLYQLGDSLDLKLDFYDLLHQFFTLLGKNIKKSFLLIQLDDTDLQFTKAYKVLEETRKCLSLPNVIVVMATDIDQLRLLVAQSYYGDLRLALEKNELDAADVRVMAAKYLDKLIPSAHAIYLPNILHNYETGRPLSFEILNYSKSDRSPRNEEETVERRDLGELQQAVFDLIYEKTGVVFIRHQFYVHHIIPRTLRGISHLYRLLDNMEPPKPPPVLGNPNASRETILTQEIWLDYCEKRAERAKILMKNLLRFEDYFLNDWCSSRLLKERWNLLREVQREAIPAQSIPYAVTLMLREIQREAKKEKESILPFRDMLKRRPLNYKTLNELIANPEEIGYTQADYTFGFALHTYFTIQFHKLALEEQIRALNAQEDNWKDYMIFSFDYGTIQRRLSPQVFDSEKIQQGIWRFPYKPFYFPVSPIAPSPIAPSRDLSGNPFIRREKEGFYCDLLHVFYNSLCRPDNKISNVTVSAQRAMLNMQDAGLYVCCNWDAQDQIIKALQDSDRYHQAMDEKDISFQINPKDTHFAQEYANAFYAYIFQYLESKKAPPLPDSSGKFGEEDDSGREGFVWKYIYHAEPNSPYFMDFSPLSEEDADSPEGANADSAEPDAGQEESP